MKARSSFSLPLLTGILLAFILLTLFSESARADFRPSMLQVKKPSQVQKTSPRPVLMRRSTTTVRLWDGRGELGKEHFQCLNNVVTSVPSVEKMKQWWVQWSTNDAGFSKAVYQVSLFPFPESAESWKSPPGLLKTGAIQKISGTGNQPLFSIDLAALMPGKMGAASIKKIAPQKMLQPRFSSSPASPSIAAKPLSPAAARSVQLKRPELKQVPTKPVLHNLARKEPFAVTFYVRIITLNAAGKPVATPSKAATLHLSTPGGSNFVWYGDPNPNVATPEIHAPAIKIASYEPFQPAMSDWDRNYIVTKDMPMFGYTKGQELFFPRDDGSKGGWEAVKDSVGSVVGFVTESINRVANAYNSLKQKALNLAISLAKNTVGCGETCQQAFTFGLDYGLAAMGMPPSLPDFDAMMSMGKDYLIAEIASEASPYLSENDVRKAVNYLESEVRKTADNGADGSKWLKLNPRFQYHDAVLMLEVSNPTGKVTDKISCCIRQSKEVFYFPFDKKNYFISIPPIKPGQTLRIPVLLRPNNVQCNNGKGMLMSDWNKMMEKPALLQVFPGNNEQVLIKR